MEATGHKCAERTGHTDHNTQAIQTIIHRPTAYKDHNTLDARPQTTKDVSTDHTDHGTLVFIQRSRHAGLQSENGDYVTLVCRP